MARAETGWCRRRESKSRDTTTITNIPNLHRKPTLQTRYRTLHTHCACCCNGMGMCKGKVGTQQQSSQTHPTCTGNRHYCRPDTALCTPIVRVLAMVWVCARASHTPGGIIGPSRDGVVSKERVEKSGHNNNHKHTQLAPETDTADPIPHSAHPLCVLLQWYGYVQGPHTRQVG